MSDGKIKPSRFEREQEREKAEALKLAKYETLAWLDACKAASPRAKSVGRMLMRLMVGDAFGYRHVSHKKMASEEGCHVSTIRRALDELKALGVLGWVESIMPGRRTTNRYCFLPKVRERWTTVRKSVGMVVSDVRSRFRRMAEQADAAKKRRAMARLERNRSSLIGERRDVKSSLPPLPPIAVVAPRSEGVSVEEYRYRQRMYASAAPEVVALFEALPDAVIRRRVR